MSGQTRDGSQDPGIHQVNLPLQQYSNIIPSSNSQVSQPQAQLIQITQNLASPSSYTQQQPQKSTFVKRPTKLLNNNQQSTSLRRGCTVIKRTSVLTQRMATSKREYPTANHHMKQSPMWKVGQTIDQQSSIERDKLAQIQRKNSSLTRRDYQNYSKPFVQILNTGQNPKRRKATSNPRQKISSNLRTIQPSIVVQKNNDTSKTIIVQHHPKKLNHNKFGYRNAANETNGSEGPREAYTAKTLSNAVLATSSDNQSLQRVEMAKKLSGSQVPLAFHISQDVNPMLMQHTNSIDRTASLDSACYDVLPSNKAHQAKLISLRSTTPKSGVSQEHFHTQQASQLAPGINLGVSQMLRHMILTQANENQQNQTSPMTIPQSRVLQGNAELEAALLSHQNSQVSQKLMGELISANQESLDYNRKQSAPISNAAESLNPSGKLETMIKQLIFRKEITKSQNISQRRLCQQNQKNIMAAHHSLQAAEENSIGDTTTELGRPVYSSKRSTAQQITNFAQSLHTSNVLKQEHSAEDLLIIGREGNESGPDRILTQKSPVRNEYARNGLKNSQERLQKFIEGNGFRPQFHPKNGSPQINVQEFHQHQNSESFGQLSGIRPQQGSATFINGSNFNQTGLTGLLDLKLSDTFGFPSGGSTGQQSIPVASAIATLSAIDAATAQDDTIVDDAGKPEDERINKGYMQTIEDPESNMQTVNQPSYEQDHLSSNAPSNLVSFQQTQQRMTLDSDASIENVYHRTLFAYQNDMNTLSQINRTRRELSDRITQHQNILKSIKGVPPQSSSVVLIDSIANTSLVNSKESTAIGSKQPYAQHFKLHLSANDPQQMMRQPHLTASEVSQQQQQTPPDDQQLRQHFSTVAVKKDNGSHQLSFLEPHGARMPIEYAPLQGLSLEPPLQQQQPTYVTTSPIVGRYRLKPVPGAAHSQVPASSKRQQSYKGQQVQIQQRNLQPQVQNSQQQRMLSSICEKRTKSVRIRRPQFAGSNMRGGSVSRKQRDDAGSSKQKTIMGTAVKSKFDSIAHVYNSSRGFCDDYTIASNSQNNFAGLASMIVASGPVTQVQQMQMIGYEGSKRQIQTIDPTQYKSCALQQTYGVAQKLTQQGAHASVKRSSAAGSVPKQRQGNGFSSNLRPQASQGAKQKERSLSHNRNRAQYSFQQQTNVNVVQQHSACNGSIAGSKQNFNMNNLHGSVQSQNTNNGIATPISGSNVDGGANLKQQDQQKYDEGLQNAVSPISIQPANKNPRSFKYRAAKQVPVASVKPRQGKSKSTSRGRGAIVANSTNIVEPGVRKHSSIVSRVGGPQNRDGKRTQLSQQQVVHFRGSLHPPQASQLVNVAADPKNSMQVSSGAVKGIDVCKLLSVDAATSSYQMQSPARQLIRKSPSPDSESKNSSISPENLLKRKAAYQQYKLKLNNKITRGSLSPDTRRLIQQNALITDLEKEHELLSNEVSVGGQDIGALTSACNIAPFAKQHNLRYSSAVNEFSNIDGHLLSGELEVHTNNERQASQNYRPPGSSSLSKEAQDRQNQAMKLINEDNPFESPPQKQQNVIPRSNKAILGKNDAASTHAQVMSFVNAKDSTEKSISDKNTERETKNSNTTLRTGLYTTSQSAAASATLTNQFKSTQKRTISNRGTISNATTRNQQANMPQRRSLLGLAAQDRSETTEDSQQCIYKDAAMLMSSLPVLMHSIRQVIAEEEPGEEQDERTTNKESNHILTATNGRGESSGNLNTAQAGGTSRDAPSDKNQSSRDQFEVCDDTPKISSASNIAAEVLTTFRKEKYNNKTPDGQLITDKVVSANAIALGAKVKKSAETSIDDEVSKHSSRCAEFEAAGNDICQKVNTNNDDEVYQGEESFVLQRTLDGNMTVPKIDIEAGEKFNQNARPPLQKDSGRYLPEVNDFDYSPRGNNLLCESDASGVHLEESQKVESKTEKDITDITPEIHVDKAKTKDNTLVPVPILKTCQSREFRNSYTRGAFMQLRDSKLLADFPPKLSESVHKKSQNSQVHSDDEVEVRRGLESENARSDMGSNPELCQSTSSLLARPAKVAENNAMFASSSKQVDQLQQKKSDKNTLSRDNLMTEEIEIDVDLEQTKNTTYQMKPLAHQARNNNYFTSEKGPNDKLLKSSLRTKESLILDDEGEEEVGGFDDAEEFKLGKLQKKLYYR